MTTTIEVTGMRVRPAMVPVRRILNTLVGRFTQGPFLLIDLELKGGGVGRVLGFTFVAIGLKVIPILLEELLGTVKGRTIAYADLPDVHDAGQKKLTHLGHEGAAKM